MQPVRILQVFTIMNRGGAESMIMNYYRNIDRTKVQFDFLVHREEKGSFEEEIELLGGKVFRMPKINFKNLKHYEEKLNNFFNTHKEYKIVHSHLNTLSKYVLKSAQKFNVPVRIAHSHTTTLNLSLNTLIAEKFNIKSISKIIIKHFLKKDIRKHSTHYFSCGKQAGEWLFGKENIDKVTIIKNAIDVKKFEYNSEKSKLNRKKLKVENRFVIGHVGGFSYPKNHIFLIDIFKKITEKNSNAILMLIGDGDLRKSIEEKVRDLNLEDKVIFYGIKKDIPFYLQAIDVFLLPSHYEGLPVVLVEAQASGLKTIVSDKVSKESKLTDHLEFIPLENNAEYWANKILEYEKGYERKNTFKEISLKGYEITTSVSQLQKFYLENY